MTTSVVPVIPKFQFCDSAGVPLVGGSLTSYLAGTTTPISTYQDSALSTANANPVVLDSRGECILWLSAANSYKFVLKNAAGSTIWTQDNITNVNMLSGSAGSASVGYLPAGTGAVASTVQTKLRENVSVKDFGAVGNGVTNDLAAELLANTAFPSAYYPSGAYVGDTLYNLYDLTPNENITALYGRYQTGLASVPSTNTAPVVWIQKMTSASSGSDQGAFYAGLVKSSGDAYSHAATSYMLGLGGTGDLIAHHARVQINGSGSNAYAGWMYVRNINVTTKKAWHACEFNGNSDDDAGYGGYGQLLRIAMADSTSANNRASTAISVGTTTTGGNNGFYVGLHFERNAVIPSAGSLGDNEAIRFDAPINSATGYGGMRFRLGNGADTGLFKYALRTDEATFVGNTVALFGTSQKVRWGSLSTNQWITGPVDDLIWVGTTINITPQPSVPTEGIRVNTVPVLGTRKTGWTAATGTATRTTYDTATVTLANLAEHVKALTDDLISHGLIGT